MISCSNCYGIGNLVMGESKVREGKRSSTNHCIPIRKSDFASQSKY